jgi:hypothetical protein
MDRFFSRRETDFAEKLAEKIHRQFPPASESSLDKKGPQRRLGAILESITKDIDAFKKESKPGWFGTARLGNTFRWKLSDLGYSKPFVEELTEGMIKQIMMKEKTGK